MSTLRTKTLALRYWLVLAMVIYFVTSISPFVYIGSVVCRTEKPVQESVAISNMVSADVARWADPEWQKQLAAQLPDRISVVLLKDDQQVFSAGTPPVDPTAAGYTQIMVMDGTQLAGIADLYDVSPCAGTIYGAVALPVSLLLQGLIILILAWVLRRYVMKPLAAMSHAARQIADGNLEFELPPSRVREVADVAAAFHAMGNTLRVSLTRQAELEQERRFFISAIAHDLRTPLFALRGYLEGLEKGVASTPEKMAHYIAICQEKADALEHLIADLFAYSRLEYLEQSPRRETMDFSRLITKAVDDIRPRAQANHVSVLLASSAAPCSVEADWSLLVRAFDNLLDNALRYTPDGGTIWVSWDKRDELVKFSVADSGIGIAAHDLPNLFKPLYRAETSRNRQTGGAGLGLTIAQRILRAHGGDLVAGNHSEGGAEFTGSFPAR